MVEVVKGLVTTVSKPSWKGRRPRRQRRTGGRRQSRQPRGERRQEKPDFGRRPLRQRRRPLRKRTQTKETLKEPLSVWRPGREKVKVTGNYGVTPLPSMGLNIRVGPARNESPRVVYSLGIVWPSIIRTVFPFLWDPPTENFSTTYIGGLHEASDMISLATEPLTRGTVVKTSTIKSCRPFNTNEDLFRSTVEVCSSGRSRRTPHVNWKGVDVRRGDLWVVGRVLEPLSTVIFCNENGIVFYVYDRDGRKSEVTVEKRRTKRPNSPDTTVPVRSDLPITR